MALATFIEVAESIGDTPGGLSPAAMRKRHRAASASTHLPGLPEQPDRQFVG